MNFCEKNTILNIKALQMFQNVLGISSNYLLNVNSMCKLFI